MQYAPISIHGFTVYWYGSYGSPTMKTAFHSIGLRLHIVVTSTATPHFSGALKIAWKIVVVHAPRYSVRCFISFINRSVFRRLGQETSETLVHHRPATV